MIPPAGLVAPVVFVAQEPEQQTHTHTTGIGGMRAYEQGDKSFTNDMSSISCVWRELQRLIFLDINIK